jgi:hypothetical protein
VLLLTALNSSSSWPLCLQSGPLCSRIERGGPVPSLRLHDHFLIPILSSDVAWVLSDLLETFDGTACKRGRAEVSTTEG